MKKIILFLLAFVSTLPIFAQTPNINFSFDGQSLASTVGSYTLTANQGATQFTANTPTNNNSHALIVDGNQHFSTPMPMSPTNGFTVSMWVNVPVISGDYDVLVAQLRRFNSSYFGTFLVGINPSGRAYMETYNNTNGSVTITSTSSLVANTWTHLAFKWIQGVSNSKMYIYMNGVVTDSLANNLSSLYSAANEPLVIGALPTNILGTIGQQSAYNGQIDEIQYYNTALTDQQIQHIYLPNSPFQEFPFDSSYYNVAGDIAFGANLGTSFVADRFGNPNNALNIQNTGCNATIPNLSYGNNPRTIAMWVKVNIFNPAGYNMIFAYGMEAFSNANGGSITPTDVMYLGYNNNYSATTTNNLNTWYHIVFTYDGTDAKVYKDGVLLGTSPRGWNTLTNGDIFKLGTGVGGELWFDGAIDDLKLYSNVLSDAQVTTLYNNSLTNSISSIETQPLLATIFPNPSSKVLNVLLDNPLNKETMLTIYDLTGKQIKNSIVYDVQNQINIEDLTPGLYLLKITNGTSAQTVKFVKE